MGLSVEICNHKGYTRVANRYKSSGFPTTLCMASDDERRRDHPPLNTPLCDRECTEAAIFYSHQKSA